ncbi:MAG TPA: class I SAM-dependent methyltransferase [Solirubrobacterales bacterium]|nr:class I SAM-dependent methyltransferase [Solirubrobacterales bacterium]
MRALATIKANLEERIALMAPARRLRLEVADDVLAEFAGTRAIRVLDAGCGDGLLSLSLAKRHPSWTIVGVDLREDMLALARARAHSRSLGNVSFESADLLKPLALSDFDAVIALECLSEIPDDEAALRTMAAAVRPDGMVVAQVPEHDWRPVLPGSATTWREQVRQGYTRDGFAAMLGRAGLASIGVRGTYRSLAAAAQEVRDRIKARRLLVRVAAFPFLATAVLLEHRGLTWGPPNAILAVGRRPDQ